MAPTVTTRLYYTTGDYGTGITKGKVDNNLYSGLFLYTVAGHTFGGGYQVSNGNSDFPWLNQGDGSSATSSLTCKSRSSPVLASVPGRLATRTTSPKSAYLA
jgi:hypothetical protein